MLSLLVWPKVITLSGFLCINKNVKTVFSRSTSLKKQLFKLSKRSSLFMINKRSTLLLSGNPISLSPEGLRDGANYEELEAKDPSRLTDDEKFALNGKPRLGTTTRAQVMSHRTHVIS